MPGETLLIGIATVAVVLAGFTGITTAVTPAKGAWTAGERIRQRAIVSTSFNVTFAALAPVVAFAALDNVHDAFVLTSAGFFIYLAFVVGVRARQFALAGALFSRATILMIAFSVTSLTLFAANALVFASVAPYALALLIQLGVAALSFYTLLATASS